MCSHGLDLLSSGSIMFRILELRRHVQPTDMLPGYVSFMFFNKPLNVWAYRGWVFPARRCKPIRSTYCTGCDNGRPFNRFFFEHRLAKVSQDRDSTQQGIA